MSLTKKLTTIVIIVLLVFSSSLLFTIKANKNDVYKTYELTKITLEDTGFTKIHSNSNFEYSYKKHNGILKVTDKKTGYIWKSGIDHDYNQYIEATTEIFLANNPEATTEEILKVAKPFETQMNNTRQGIANSLVVFDMLSPTSVERSATQVGSSSKTFIIQEIDGIDVVAERVSNSIDTDVLYKDKDNESHFVLNITLKTYDLNVKVHLFLNENGFDIQIYDHEILGEDSNNIGYINIMPYLGSYGGKQLQYDTDANDWVNEVLKERKEGYVFVPDGSGAIIKFNDYNSKLSGYTGNVFGEDLAQSSFETKNIFSNVPIKDPLMPLFGIAYEKENAAFLAYAKSGYEHMQILSRPNDSSDSYNLTNYNIAFPRFLYNKGYTQVFNQAGDSYAKLLDERNRYDLNLTYHFINENANYLGMADVYKTYLVNEGILNEKIKAYDDIQIRIDFLMADVKNTLFGNSDVVVTTTDDVSEILEELLDNNIKGINSGLYGYQKGGISLGKKNSPNFSSSIGSKTDFKHLNELLQNKGIDLSLALDYVSIIEDQMRLSGNVSKHINSWYINKIDNNNTNGFDNKSYYAKPEKIANWIKSNENAISKIGFNSMTFEGFTNQLYSDYNNVNLMTTDVIDLYSKALAEIDNKVLINAYSPNQYLWQYVDRFLQTPMFSSQYLVQTEEVPFLQYVLSGTMELYSTYINFSFYEKEDILKIIDYNTFPAFILTKESSHLLAQTNSANFYSTEYNVYKEMIKSVYDDVNGALKYVLDQKWINREVVSNDVVVNKYSGGTKIVINYSNTGFTYNNQFVEAKSYKVIGG